MCWQLQIKIIPQKPKRSYDMGYLESLIGGQGFVGELHTKSKSIRILLNDGFCLCNHFRDNSRWAVIAEIVAGIARNPQTKRVKALKFWGELPKKSLSRKIGLAGFLEMDENGELTENIAYSVRDEGKDTY